MRRALPAAGLLLLALPVAAADEPPDNFALLAPLRKFIDAFNKQETKLPADAFADPCAIIDTASPYLWSGPGAAPAWYARLVGATPAEQKQFQAAKKHLMIADPRFLKVEGDHLCFVIEGTLDYVDGDSGHRTIGLWTVSETRAGDQWRIAGLAWGILRED